MKVRQGLLLLVSVFSLFLLTMGCGKKGGEGDTTPPETTITSQPPNPSNSPDATFTFICNEGNCTFDCGLDDSGYTACTSPKTYTGLTEGKHTFSVRAIDSSGNIDPSPAQYFWTIETPPETTITFSPPNQSNSASATFAFTCDESSCDFECDLDGGGYSACTSPKVYTGLANGSHTFSVRARDAAGNVDPTPASYTWAIDTTPPETTITSQPPNPSNSTSATFAFTCDESSCDFECDLDGIGYISCTSPKTYTVLSEETHTFSVRAIDTLGNVDPTPVSYTWTIDTTPPDTTITSNPPNPSSSRDAGFTFSCNESSCDFECELDGGGYSACTSPKVYIGLANGSHTFSVRAKDSAGNIDPTPASYTWTIQFTDSWVATRTIGAPTARGSHTAVWTGSVMIVWGGLDVSTYLNTGGRYNPVTDSWTPTSTTNAPTGRRDHTAVWTGSVMIVWGGRYYSGGHYYLNTGGRYNPSTDSWTDTSTTDAPTGRTYHTAVWTGSEMIVWGGYEWITLLNTGGRYNPSTDSWTPTSTTDAPSGRYLHTAVWTGSEMIVWGGYDGSYLNTGGRYNPSTDSWTSTSTTNAPTGRREHTAVWTGSVMIVWGGDDVSTYLNTGGRYDPSTDSWTATSTSGAPTGRTYHTAVWTGSEMIVWGGFDSGGYLNPGGRYNPSTDSWTPTSTAGAPTGRHSHTAVWTETEMIVWGGEGIGGSTNTGGRYTP